MRKGLLNFLRLVTGLLILSLLIAHTGLSRIMDSFHEFNLGYLPVVFILYFVSYSMGMFNIAVLLIPLRKHIPLARLLKYSLLGSGLGSLFPGRVGELSIIYFLRQEGLPLGKASALVLIDRLVTFFVLVSVSFFSLMIFFSWGILYFFISLILFSSFLIYLSILWRKGRSFLRHKIMRWHHYLFKGFFRTFVNFMKYYRKAVYVNVFLTVLKWLFYSASIFGLLLCFSVRVNFLYVFIAEAVVALVSLIPVSVNGMGIKESTAVFFYSLLGVPPSVTLAVYLSLQVGGIVLAVAFSFLFWKDIRRLTSSVKKSISSLRRNFV